MKPDDLLWQDKELPNLTKSKDRCKGRWILAWFVNDVSQEEYDRIKKTFSDPKMLPLMENNGKLRRVAMIHAHENDLNPLRLSLIHI